MVANRSSVGSWETFELVQAVPNANIYSLRAANGQYVAAEGGGGGAVYANRNSVGPYEEFEMISLSGVEVAFKTLSGHYLRVEASSGILDAVATDIGPWERFQLVPQ